MKHHSCRKYPLCPLAKTAKSVQVCGASGTECDNKKRIDPEWWTRKCKVMFIAEAPGKDEDKKGIPLIGNAGKKLFSSFIKKAGFDLDEIFLTNSTKCIPPKDRQPFKPTVQEIKACKRHLEFEIKHFQPEVVVLLGNVSLRTFNLHNEGSISQIRGKVFEKKFPGWEDGPTFKIVPTFHPAFFLHQTNRITENRVLQDFILIKQLSEGKSVTNGHYKVKYEVCKTLEDVIMLSQYLSAQKEFAVDTESVSLPWYKQPLRCFSFSWGKDNNWILPIYEHDPDGEDLKLKRAWSDEDLKRIINIIRKPLENEGIAKIFHNAPYDINVIRKWTDIQVKGMIYDTVVLHHLLEEVRPHDLESLANLELNTGDYSFNVRKVVGQGKSLKKTYDHVPDGILYPYTAIDVESAFKLKQIYWERIQENPDLKKLYMEESYPIIEVLTEAEWYGTKIDTEIVKTLLAEQNQLKEACWKEIIKITQDPDFNPSSPKQVAAILTKLGYEKEIFSAKNSSGYCTDEATLEELVVIGCDLARLILAHRKIVKLMSTYLEKALDEVDVDGRLRYSWLIHGTVTGRLSCPYLHTVPRMNEERMSSGKHNLRDMFISEDGYCHIYGDFSQIELRIIAILSNDSEMKKAFENGEDIHTVTASAILGVLPEKITAEWRNVFGKDVNFGVSYGSRGYKLQGKYYTDPKDKKRKVLTLDKIQVFMNEWRKKFSGIAKFLDDVPGIAMAQGKQLSTVFGRVRRLPNLGDMKRKVRQAAEREAGNFLIQGPAGAITIRTAIEVHKMRKKFNLTPEDFRLVNTVHDSLDYEVKDEYKEWFMQALKAVAEREIPELENTRFPISIGAGSSWGAAELDSKG